MNSLEEKDRKDQIRRKRKWKGMTKRNTDTWNGLEEVTMAKNIQELKKD